MTMAFSFVFPFLLMMALGQNLLLLMGKCPKGWTPTLFITLTSGLLVILPVGSLPAGRWMVSLYANPSIPVIALLFSWILKNAFQIQFLDSKAIQTCWGFSLLAGAALYPAAMGIGTFDPYAAGWHFSGLFTSLMAITLTLIFIQNRFSAVLLATILAYDFHLLESENLWDYLVDPLLVLLSAGVILRNAFYHSNKATSGPPLES